MVSDFVEKNATYKKIMKEPEAHYPLWPFHQNIINQEFNACFFDTLLPVVKPRSFS